MATVYIQTVDDLENLVNGTLGTGTSSVPLEVELTNDIDFSELDDSDERKWNFRYTGTPSVIYLRFDGGGHSIKNIAYSNISNDWSLFYSIGGSISNLTLNDINIVAANSYGFTARLGAAIILTNCHIRGVVAAASNAAGLSGYSGATGRLSVSRCSFSGNLTGNTVYGLASGYGANASRSYVAGNLRTTGSSVYMLGSSNTRATNTFFRGQIYGSPTTLLFTGGSSNYCYVMIQNPTDLSGQYALWITSSTLCFYNNDEYDYGASSIAASGTDKDNLQDASWLRNQGWAI